MWSLPRHVLTYVLAVDILAIATTGAMVPVLPVTRADGVAAIILGICAIAHIELSRSIERARKLTSGVGPFVDSLTLWDFAAVIVLPPALASGLIVFTHTIAWLRVWRGRRPLYRWVFSDATVLLATQAAALVLLIGPEPHPGVPAGLGGLAIILVAAIVRWFVNYALVVGAILISSPGMRARAGHRRVRRADHRSRRARPRPRRRRPAQVQPVAARRHRHRPARLAPRRPARPVPHLVTYRR